MHKNNQAKETVLVITVGLLVLHLVFKGRGFLYGALGVGLVGVFSVYLSEKIHWAWNKLSLVLSAVSNRVLLAVIYLLVVTPMGLIRRMGRKGFDPGAKSNFSEREKVFGKGDFEKTW